MKRITDVTLPMNNRMKAIITDNPIGNISLFHFSSATEITILIPFVTGV
jgi:hypothetical protein